MNKDKTNELYSEIRNKAQRLQALGDEIFDCERIIYDYKESLEFEREIYAGGTIFIPYFDYVEAMNKLSKLREEYAAVESELHWIIKYLNVITPKKTICDHMGKCTICGWWSKIQGCTFIE